MSTGASSPYTESDDSGTPYQVSSEIWMAPCTIDSRTNTFVPSLRPSQEMMLEKSPSRQAWSPHEDEMLRRIIMTKGTKAWTSIALELNQQLHQSQAIRHGKQCRERWYNHLNPYLRKGNWSPSEDLVLLEKQLEYGNRWSDISKLLPGRNENSVKNRWKSITRKAQKEVAAGMDPIQWLIAERQGEMVEAEGRCVIGAQFPMVQVFASSVDSEQYAQTVVDAVKRELRSFEQPFLWTPYAFQPQSDGSSGSLTHTL